MEYYIEATLAAFLSTYLRGFQNLNLASGHRKSAVVTGYFMHLSDAVVIGLFIVAGVHIAFASGIGAGLGYYFSMATYSWLIRRYRVSTPAPTPLVDSEDFLLVKPGKRARLRKHVRKSIGQWIDKRSK